MTPSLVSTYYTAQKMAQQQQELCEIQTGLIGPWFGWLQHRQFEGDITAASHLGQCMAIAMSPRSMLVHIYF